MRRHYTTTDQPEPPMMTVTNLLPQFVQNYWTFDRLRLVNPSYPVSNYSGESVKPEGNIMVVISNPSYPECYFYPNQDLWPYLSVGHTYYIRWFSRKEAVMEGGTNDGVSEDLYWPEMENALIRGLNSSNYMYFRKNSTIMTLNQSQWPNNTVANGNYKIRFDCNNQRKTIRHLVYADFMLVDLTETYTNRGLSVPTLQTLTAKPYFYGTISLDNWVS